jgi:hypothetical protein
MGGSEPGDQTEANLRLIAEAPQMLALLEMMIHEQPLMIQAGMFGAMCLLKRVKGGR